ncbi:MAG: hypothetical protein FWD19_06050 [Defluviitaleaceae bacterium]|nr:hypothetical protein [Defluviitaleaceae bacterium]
MFNKVGDFFEVMGENAKVVANQLGLTVAGRDVGLPERVPLVGIPAHNFEKIVDALVKNNFKIAVAEKLNVTERLSQPAPTIDLKIVADYMQKQYDTIKSADPNKIQGQAAFSMTIKRLEKANERIPDTQPQLKALIANAAQSTDFNMLKERMETLKIDFIQHYSPAVQNTIDTGGKVEPPAPKSPTQGENVAAIEAKVKAGEVINLTDLSDAIKKDKQAHASEQNAKRSTDPAKPSQSKPPSKTTKTRTYAPHSGNKFTPKSKTPSIKEELAANKQKLSAQKSAPARTASKNKNELGG